MYLNAKNYRVENSHFYGLGSYSSVEPWLASPSLIEELRAQYELLESTLNSFPDSFKDDQEFQSAKTIRESPSLLLSELRTQLVDIGDNLIGSLCERIFFLELYQIFMLIFRLSTPSSEKELEKYKALVEKIQEKVILPLGKKH